MANKIIKFEGFCDLKSWHDFDMPMFLIKPVMQMHDVGNLGGGPSRSSKTT